MKYSTMFLLRDLKTKWVLQTCQLWLTTLYHRLIDKVKPSQDIGWTPDALHTVASHQKTINKTLLLNIHLAIKV